MPTLLLLLILGGSSIASAKDSIHKISISDMKFTPAITNAQIGDVIEWSNQDLVPHSVTSDNKQFDSKAILPNKNWSMKLKKKGNFNYHCTFHPVMKGQLLIK